MLPVIHNVIPHTQPSLVYREVSLTHNPLYYIVESRAHMYMMYALAGMLHNLRRHLSRVTLHTHDFLLINPKKDPGKIGKAVTINFPETYEPGGISLTLVSVCAYVRCNDLHTHNAMLTSACDNTQNQETYGLAFFRRLLHRKRQD